MAVAESRARSRRGMCAARVLLAFALYLSAAALAGCGGAAANEEQARTSGEPRPVEIDGVSIALPAGWAAYTTRIGPDDAVAVIWAANTPFSERSARPEYPRRTLAALPADGVAVEIVTQPNGIDAAAFPLLSPPIRLADGYFLADAYEGQPAAHVSSQIIHARLADGALYVQVYFGRNEPGEELRALADEVLATLTVAGGVDETREDSFVRFHDPETGIAGRYPESWHRARALTNLAVPREVLALATYPLRGGAKAGECAPDTARADMPPGGAFLWLLEYRPLRDELGNDLPLSRFPEKPSRFETRRGDLGENLSCFLGPGYSTTFRAAGRPFQLLVAFGGRPTDGRLAEVGAILDGLEFERLPPPPPDPYSGWPLLVSNSGDSLRPPPGWAAAAAMFPVETTRRPRTLFFASNRRLFGLPDRLSERVDGLPPGPSWAVATDFPADAVLLWVTEEEKGGELDEFPAIGRGWPGKHDFRPLALLTKANPEVRWRRAGGSFRGYRFSVLVGAGPTAAQADVELALRSGASLAVSGCWRDVIDDCPDR
jgi:hypothetical protein